MGVHWIDVPIFIKKRLELAMDGDGDLPINGMIEILIEY